jgi:hypothetical protein
MIVTVWFFSGSDALSSKDRAADHDVRQGNNSTICWPIGDSPARSDYDEIGDWPLKALPPPSRPAVLATVAGGNDL